jgi:hypothetical protein
MLSKADQYEKTMELFQQEGMFPNEFTFFKVLNACVVLQALEEGRLHPFTDHAEWL